MKHLLVLAIVLVAATAGFVACSKNTESSNTSTNMSSSSSMESMATASSGGMMAAAPKLPIPLSKLKSITVAPGNASAGAAVFSANCASCHGEGGKNGQVGPTLAGAGLKPGQVAFMVRNPQAIDKDSGMPKLPLTDKQLADVAAYVASLK